MLFHEPETSRSNESKVFRGIPKISFECARERGCIPDSLEREIVRLNLGTPGSKYTKSKAKDMILKLSTTNLYGLLKFHPCEEESSFSPKKVHFY